jgi:hypothetical protein
MPEGSVYFDAVFDKDFIVLFDGTQEAVLEWLKSQLVDVSSYNVVPGKILLPMSVEEYLKLYG